MRQEIAALGPPDVRRMCVGIEAVEPVSGRKARGGEAFRPGNGVSYLILSQVTVLERVSG